MILMHELVICDGPFTENEQLKINVLFRWQISQTRNLFSYKHFFHECQFPHLCIIHKA